MSKFYNDDYSDSFVVFRDQYGYSQGIEEFMTLALPPSGEPHEINKVGKTFEEVAKIYNNLGETASLEFASGSWDTYASREEAERKRERGDCFRRNENSSSPQECTCGFHPERKQLCQYCGYFISENGICGCQKSSLDIIKGSPWTLKKLKEAIDFSFEDKDINSEMYYDGCNGPFEREFMTKCSTFGIEWNRKENMIDRARDCSLVYYVPEMDVIVPEGLVVVVKDYNYKSIGGTRDWYNVYNGGEKFDFGSREPIILKEGESVEVTKTFSEGGHLRDERFLITNKNGKGEVNLPEAIESLVKEKANNLIIERFGADWGDAIGFHIFEENEDGKLIWNFKWIRSVGDVNQLTGGEWYEKFKVLDKRFIVYQARGCPSALIGPRKFTIGELEA